MCSLMTRAQDQFKRQNIRSLLKKLLLSRMLLLENMIAKSIFISAQMNGRGVNWCSSCDCTVSGERILYP